MSDFFYFAENEKVQLTPSNHFVAIQAKTDADKEQLKETVEKSAGFLSGETLEEIDATGMMLVGIEQKASEKAVSDSVNSLRDDQNVEFQYPVFQMPEGDIDELMILIPQFRVQFKADAKESDIKKLLAQHDLTVIMQDDLGENSYLLKAEKGSPETALDLANQLHQHKLTEYAEPDWVYQMKQLSSIVSNGNELVIENEDDVDSDVFLDTPEIDDPEIEAQGPSNDRYYRYQWALPKMRVPQAWRISKGSSRIKVAVVDEGVQVAHPDLAGKIVTPYDAVGNDNNQNPNSWDGHGTACAGIVAARTGNRIGIAGVAPNCKILPVRIAYTARPRSNWITTTSWIARGIRVAALRGADVISNSWGGGPYSSTIRSAFQYAHRYGRGGKGCVIISATGNNDRRGIFYPAKYPESMACGASNQWDQRKSRTSRDGERNWGSNYGPELDFVAPGVQIYTTDNVGSGGYSPGNYFSRFNGTSSATPNAAGVAALVLSVDPNLRQWEVRDILRLTARDLGDRGKDEQFGYGRINAEVALQAAKRIWYQSRLNLQFLGRGRECYMRFKLFRLYNSGLNRVRVNSFQIRSFGPTGKVIDRFSYRPDPGGIMQPGLSSGGGSGDDIRFENILLKAHGNRSSFRYSWRADWSYTFWRPSRPITSPADGMEAFNGDDPGVEETFTVSLEGGNEDGVMTQPSELNNKDSESTVLDNGAVKVTIQVN